MASFVITKLYMYKWRYVIGYSLMGLALIILLTMAGLLLPGGISQLEMGSVVKSNSLSFSDFRSFAIINLPYYMLQALSLSLFGVHDFTIKLPSLILGLFSAVGIILLLSRWFRRNIAILSSFIAITTGQFLFVSQDGTPGILYIFWPVVILLLGVLISRSKRFLFAWKVLFFISAALSLYTPLSIYPLLAMVLAGFLHPHLRNIIRRLSRTKLVVALLIGLIIISPLIYGVISHPSLGLELLGIPSQFPNFLTNLHLLGQHYFNFWHPGSGTLMTPVYGLGTMMLIAYGIYRVIRTSETTQSYLIIAWLVCLIPVLIIDPDFTSVVFIPLVLLLTIGMDRLVNYWYRLFPRNPYARFAGLIPLIALVLALVSSGLDRYVYGYYYQPQTVQNFSTDLSLLPKSTRYLVVSQSQLPFYDVVARHNSRLIVTQAPVSPTFTVTREAHTNYPGYTITKIITSDSSQNADRFYIYTSSTSSHQ